MNKTALHGDFPKQLTEFFDPAKSTSIAVAKGDVEFDLLTKHAAETTNQSFRLRDAVPEKKQGLCDSKKKHPTHRADLRFRAPHSDARWTRNEAADPITR